MRESTVEKKLVRQVARVGGKCLKFTPFHFNGAPDRLVLLPGGRLCFVEVKGEGGFVRPLQKKRLQQLEGLGFKCYVVQDQNSLDEFVRKELMSNARQSEC